MKGSDHLRDGIPRSWHTIRWVTAIAVMLIVIVVLLFVMAQLFPQLAPEWVPVLQTDDVSSAQSG